VHVASVKVHRGGRIFWFGVRPALVTQAHVGEDGAQGRFIVKDDYLAVAIYIRRRGTSWALGRDAEDTKRFEFQITSPNLDLACAESMGLAAQIAWQYGGDGAKGGTRIVTSFGGGKRLRSRCCCRSCLLEL